MTLAETLLPKLASWRPAGAGRHSWAENVADQGWAVSIQADQVDSLSCLLWEVGLQRSGAEPAEGATLRSRAEGIAKRVTGLLEPLRLIEVDEPRQEAILRSTAPAHRGDEVLYYEVHLYGLDRAVVRRFETSPKTSNRREQVPFALTHEVIAKLADDLRG